MSDSNTATGEARALEAASNHGMVGSELAAEFWGAVQDCLVQFHNFSRAKAAEKVTDTWRKLSNLVSPSDGDTNGGESRRSFVGMIYHEEPWYIACNLADNQMALNESYRPVYEQILQRNHLA